MRPDATPTVSIGLPVYNGANFLAETLDSILAQTYQDFELIIVDNASTDETAEICERYAQQDGRVRYHRNEQNIGAAANYNLAFELGRGRYFKWAAADDLIAPAFLERCVEVLEQDPGVVLCFTRTLAIDDNGDQIKEFPSKRPLESPDPKRQFRGWVMDPNPVVAVFGLARREILARTRLIGKYSGSDRPLLSELSLLGRFHEVPEFLFYYRIHAGQSWGGNKSHHAQQAWYDPNRKDKLTFPHWRLLSEHMKSIGRSPVNFGDRVACYGAILIWMRRNWRPLYQNLTLRDVQYRVN